MPEDEETESWSGPGKFNYWRKTDRDRGILTKKDREFLAGERELEGQDKRNTRYRIRQRVIQSLLDLRFIITFLSHKDKQQIANDEKISIRSVSTILIWLAYDLILKSWEGGTPTAENQLENAIIRAITKHHDDYFDEEDYNLGDMDGTVIVRNVDVPIQINTETMDTADLAENLMASDDGSGNGPHVTVMQAENIGQLSGDVDSLHEEIAKRQEQSE